MNIRKYAETNMEETCFYGKVEVETNDKKEWEDAIQALKAVHKDGVVCHCNLKENAELIAAILDYDVENKAYPQK